MPEETSHRSETFQVVIIGGGLAGLTAALYLAERDIEPLVLEADAIWPGGRLAGGENEVFEYGGRTWAFRPDHGVHALWGEYHNMRAVLARLGVELRLTIGEDWVDRWGREIRITEAGQAVRYSWISAPFHYLMLLLQPSFWTSITPLDFLSLPGYLVSTLLTVGIDPIAEQRGMEGLMLSDFFTGWTRNLRVTFIGLARNLLAAPDEVISLSAFIACLRFYTLLRRDAWTLEFMVGNTHDQLVMPIIRCIEELGGMVLNGVEAAALAPENDHWLIRVEDKLRGGRRSIHAQNVILAVEPPAAERLFAASPAIADRADDLNLPPALPNIAVRMWFSRALETGAPSGMFTGDFAMDNFFWFHRLYDEFREWHEETGGSVLEVHLYGKGNLFELSDKALLVRVVSEVGLAWPALRGHFVRGSVRRNSQTQTLFQIPAADSLHIATPWPGLYACGDWIGHPTPALNMERSVITSIEAANMVLRAYEQEPVNIIPTQRPEIMARGLEATIKGIRWLLGPPVTGLVRLVRTFRGR